MKLFIYAHTASLLSNFVFQFGNEMLLTSFFASSLIVMFVIVFLEDVIESKIGNLIVRCLIKVRYVKYFNSLEYETHNNKTYIYKICESLGLTSFKTSFIQGSLWLIGTFMMKKLISTVLSIADDAHIFDILKSKFTDYANFHTMLYTCAK